MRFDSDDNWKLAKPIVVALLIGATGFNIVQFSRFVSYLDIDPGLRNASEIPYNSLIHVFIFISAIAIVPELRSRLVEILCLGLAVSFVEVVGLQISFDSTKHTFVSANSMRFYASLAFTFLVMTYGFIRLIRKTGGPARVYFILGMMFTLVFCGRMQVLLYWSHRFRLLWWGNDGWRMSLLLLVWMLCIGLFMMLLARLLLKNEVLRNRVADSSHDAN